MRIYTTILVLLFTVTLKSQNALWSNDGAFVSIKDGAYLSIDGDAMNQNGGHYNNTDSIFLIGNWTNNAGNRAFDSIPAGFVFLYANANQRMNGSDPTHFYNLILKTGGIKYADVDQYVDGYIDLTNRECSADTNTVWVTNPALNAVRRDSGFLSSLNNGGLARLTDTTGVYLYPVGSSSGIARYRPVTITPTAVNNNYFKVRFANVDPSIENFDRNKKFHLVCQINPNWYHRIFHPYGSDSAEIVLMYDTVADGVWNDIVHWQNVPQWESIKRDTIIAGTPFNRINKTRWNGFDYSPFALAITSPPFAVAGVDTLIWRTDTIQLNASGGVTYDWTPDYNLSCANCNVPFAWPDSSTLYHLTVMNNEGCYDYDSLQVLVKDKPFSLFFIPDVITPNGDGYNDVWHVRDLERYPDNAVRIINRWGDEVYSAAPYPNNWGGTYGGKELPGATYYYVIHVKFKGEDHEYNGPLTVVR